MMDERRDLVDREELRRRIKANESAYDAWSYRNAMHLLDAMPSVECPRGWTRDEVLAELDAAEQRGDKAVCKFLSPFADDWITFTRRTIESWHPEVRRYDVRVEVVERAPEWVPLTQLVGRTIDGETLRVETAEVTLLGASWRNKKWQWFPFPDGTLNLETGQVAVRPEAAT